MAINRIEIKDFLVFKGEFVADFCPGVNVLIGGNGTGKTTLIKTIYYGADRFSKSPVPSEPFKQYFGATKTKGKIVLCVDDKTLEYSFSHFHQPSNDNITLIPIYIPEKDILEHSKGLLTFIDKKQTGFSPIYKDVLLSAQDVPTQKQSATQKSVGEKIAEVIGGHVKWDESTGTFYMIRLDGTRIPFAAEASGFKRLGYLGLLVACGQLEEGSVLFWDEPENGLNPELVPILVDILLELSRGGVQLFIATHNYNLARYFDVRRDKRVPVMYHILSKTDDGHIVCVCSPDYIKLPGNHLEKASADLFKAVVSDAMEGQNDE